MARFDGHIEVLDNGVTIYYFLALRKTAQYDPEHIRKGMRSYLNPFWYNRKKEQQVFKRKIPITIILVPFIIAALLKNFFGPALILSAWTLNGQPSTSK